MPDLKIGSSLLWCGLHLVARSMILLLPMFVLGQSGVDGVGEPRQGHASRPFCGYDARLPFAAQAGKFRLNQVIPDSVRIPANPVGKSFRVAALFCKLADDIFEAGAATAEWPANEAAPIWQDDLLVSVPFDSATFETELASKPASLTAFYYQMSNGNLWLFGDAITYTGPPLFAATGDSLERYNAWADNNRQILQWLADSHDLRSLDNDGDDHVEMIVLICRARAGFGFQGISAIPISDAIQVAAGQPKIDENSGIYQKNCFNMLGCRQVVTHETGHRLGFGHVNGLHRWNLMSGSGPMSPGISGMTMSGWERHYLGWLDYKTITQDSQDIRLQNITQSGRALRLPIANSEDFLVLENRQYSEPFEPRPTLPGTGLLIYFVAADSAQIIPADGRVSRIIVQRRDETHIFYQGDNTDLFGNFGRTELTPFTRPSSRTPNVPFTGISITNIRKMADDMVFDIRFNSSQPPDAPISQIPTDFRLLNYPNPFTSTTSLTYRLHEPGPVKLQIFNTLGQRVATVLDEVQEAWDYQLSFNGGGLPAGVYFFVLQTMQGRQAHRMILVR